MKRSRLFANAAVAAASLVVTACSCGCPHQQQQSFNSQQIGRGPPKG